MSKELFYWIKLSMDFFGQDTIDWLKDQDNGCEYIVLYLQLCLLSANNNGVLVRHVGGMDVPYDAKKIADRTRFPLDIVMAAMRIFTKLGLIEIDAQGIITIPTVPAMVGSRSASKDAMRKRAYRARKKVMAFMASEDKGGDSIQDNTQDTLSHNMSQMKGKMGHIADKTSHTVSGTKNEGKLVGTKCPNAVQDTLSHTRVGQTVPKRDKWDKTPTENGTTNGTKRPIEYKSIEIKSSSSSNWKVALDAYQNNIHSIANEAEKDLLLNMLQEYGIEWLTKAIEEAALQRAYTIKYVDGILRNWSKRGVSDPWNYSRKSSSKEGKANGGHAGNRNRNADSPDSEADEIDWSQYDDTYQPGT